jgi:hypothetical protein
VPINALLQISVLCGQRRDDAFEITADERAGAPEPLRLAVPPDEQLLTTLAPSSGAL